MLTFILLIEVSVISKYLSAVFLLTSIEVIVVPPQSSSSSCKLFFTFKLEMEVLYSPRYVRLLFLVTFIELIFVQPASKYSNMGFFVTLMLLRFLHSLQLSQVRSGLAPVFSVDIFVEEQSSVLSIGLLARLSEEIGLPLKRRSQSSGFELTFSEDRLLPSQNRVSKYGL